MLQNRFFIVIIIAINLMGGCISSVKKHDLQFIKNAFNESSDLLDLEIKELYQEIEDAYIHNPPKVELWKEKANE